MADETYVRRKTILIKISRVGLDPSNTDPRVRGNAIYKYEYKISSI